MNIVMDNIMIILYSLFMFVFLPTIIYRQPIAFEFGYK